ncbi:DNA translocase FtsK [Alkalicoccus daliensis]|uniref:DNA segregation ATPase FtsK/SpoIIIE, S-DNA-T family n=1 Tax=Alkalicoccus daliensis TaxID=745820 RepID=A0A1H0A853_9BACI|nr:DNA translocase FtsK [Alkalicoccus daliensis]SDN29808.1 DNA segregation ATPase FtsK/SpoIIIE, S-DNA-T family [Alkalicoccus daliensis]
MASTKNKKTTKKQQLWKRTLKYEITGLFLLIFAVVILFSLGPAGETGQAVFRFIAGSLHVFLSLGLLYFSLFIMWKRQFPVWKFKNISGLLLLIAGITMLAHIPLHNQLSNPAFSDPFSYFMNNFGNQQVFNGGITGAFFFQSAYQLIAFAGAVLTALGLTISGVIILSGRSFVDILKKSNELQKPMWKILRKKVTAQWNNFLYELKERWSRRKEKKAQTSVEETTASPETEPNSEADNEQEPEIYDFTATAYEEKDPVENDSSKDSDMEPDENEPEAPAADEDIKIQESSNLVVQELENRDYELPKSSLLQVPKQQSQSKEHSMLSKNARKLEETLASFGVSAKVTKVHLGPSVTKYEVYPATGVKVSKIVNLTDDLALALAAKGIRMEAPIPGKSAIGIEVPNTDVALVTLREVLESSKMKQEKNPLAIALGRDISGEAVMAELNKMPHLLVAGATGSGKSVCINGIIISILLRSKPHEVKLMMIDPKMVELNVYNGIPHLLSPVVTEPKKAAQALKKVVNEMERRYELFASTGTRNIEGYNQLIRRENETREEAYSALPYIVVLVDELADLMMVASGEVEDSITRLAQMARAAGIHLIIATQRPSVDVITGVIKANIPSRIAFGVSSSTDSRTILDGNGAEKLLGKGDMLFLPVGANKPTRIQGAFLADEEVESVVRHCIEQQKAQYAEEMMPSEEPETETAESDDALFPDAVQLVTEMQTASVSMLQRRFRVGYARAARLIDEMEQQGIVGPYEGSKPREVLAAKREEE